MVAEQGPQKIMAIIRQEIIRGAHFSSKCASIGVMPGLVWPLGKNDTYIHEAFPIFVFNGYRVSVRNDDNVLAVPGGDGHTTV